MAAGTLMMEDLTMLTLKPEILVLYDDGAHFERVARINAAGENFQVSLEARPDSGFPYSPRQLQLFIRRMIDLPLKVNAMRRRTMPALFQELKPGSEEHLEAMCRQTGPFRLVSRQA